MSECQDLKVGSDADLSTKEKETTLNCPNDTDECTITTEVPTIIKWVLSVDESEVKWSRRQEGKIVAISAQIPKGIIKLQSSARKSNQHSQMVSYGEELGND